VIAVIDLSDLLGNWNEHLDEPGFDVGSLGELTIKFEVPDVVKDSFEGHHIAGTPDTYKHGWIKIGVGVDSSHLSLKKNGDVVHKPTGTVIGHVDKKTDFPTKGTSTFVTSHANGKQVYNGVYKKDAMAAVARYHNHAASTDAHAAEIAPTTTGHTTPEAGMNGSYLHTTSAANATKIQSEGFSHGEGYGGSIAHGTYLSVDKPTAEYYHAQMGPNAQTLSVTVSGLKNTAHVSFDTDKFQIPTVSAVAHQLNLHDSFEKNKLTLKGTVPNTSLNAHALTKTLQDAGYDSLHIHNHNASGKVTSVGGNELVVFDPHHLSVSKAPGHKPTLNDLPEGSVPIMSGTHVTGYKDPAGNWYDDKGNLTVTAPKKPGAPNTTTPSSNPISGTTVPKALAGEDAYQHAKASQGYLNPTQMNALAKYGQPEGYKTVNPFLNKDGMVYNSNIQKYLPATEAQTKSAQTMIKHLDAAFATSKPTTQDMIVHRRIGDGDLLLGPPGSHVGKVFHNKAYVSTTTATGGIPGNGYGYENKKTLLDIQVPTGSKVLMGQAAEKEVILPRGAKFTVVHDEVEPDGTRHVKLLYHPEDTPSAAVPKTKPVAKPEVTPAHVPAAVAPVPGGGGKPEGTMSLKKNGELKGYYHLENHTVYDVNGNPIGTSLSKIGALHLASGKHETAAELGAHATVTAPDVPVPAASSEDNEALAKQLSDHAIAMEDTMEESPDLNSAVHHMVQAAGSISSGKKNQALSYLSAAKKDLYYHGQAEPGDADSVSSYQHHISQIENKLNNTEVPSPAVPDVDHELVKKIEDHAEAMDGNLHDSTYLPLAVLNTKKAADHLKKGNKKGAVNHLDLASVQLSSHAKVEPDDAEGVAQFQQHFEQFKNKINGDSSPLIPASVHIPAGSMIDSTDLSMKTNGYIVHKQSKKVIGHVEKQKDFPSKGTTTFTVTHNDGTKVYTGPYKGKSLAALAQHHNTQGSTAFDPSNMITYHDVDTKKPIGHWDNATNDVYDTSGNKIGNTSIPKKAKELMEASVNKPAGPPAGAEPVLDKYGTGDVIGYHHPQTGQVTNPQGYVVGYAGDKKTAAKQLLNAQAKAKAPSVKPASSSDTGYHGNIKLQPEEAAGVKGVRASIAHPVISSAEKNAALLYSGSDYKAMNWYVSNGYQFGSKFDYHTQREKDLIKDAVDDLVPAINRSVVKKPFAVNRRIPAHAAVETFGQVGSRVGKSYKENRFVSTTVSAHGIGSFGEAEIHYHMKPGAKALDLNNYDASKHPNEKEILLGPGQSFKVISDKMLGKTRVIEVESQ